MTINMIEAAIATARANGCNCDPDITITALDAIAPGLIDICILHDNWCHLLTKNAAPQN